MKNRKNLSDRPKRTQYLSKAQIEEKIREILLPPPISKPTWADRIISDLAGLKRVGKWIRQNPKIGSNIAYIGSDDERITIRSDHREKFVEMKRKISSEFLYAMLHDDASYFKKIATAISKKKHVESKLNYDGKRFPLKKLLLLKAAFAGNENIHQLAREMIKSGQVPKSSSEEAVIRDLFRVRKKLKLRPILARG